MRSIGFLFSRNRLNVAISRAQALAVLVCSPKLLEIRCRTIEDMRLVNALCRFVELAEERVWTNSQSIEPRGAIHRLSNSSTFASRSKSSS